MRAMHYRFGPFALDTDTAALVGPEGPIALRPMSFKVLVHLLEQAPNLVANDALLDAVWGRQAVSPGVVSQSIRELRQALADSAQAPVYIETKHRLGYRFIAAVERDASEPAANAAPAAPTAPGPSPGQVAAAQPTRPLLRSVWLPILALSAALLSLAWYSLAPDSPRRAAALAEFEIVRAAPPQEPQALAWYQQGLAALRGRRLPEARALFEQVLAREPGAIAAMAALADTLAQLGELAPARQWATSAMAAAAGLPRAEQLRLKGFAAALDYRWGEAIAHYTAVVGLDAGDSASGFRLFDAQLAAGRSKDAQATLDALQALPPAQRSNHRLSMSSARLATLRGDQNARLEHARSAEAQAGDAQARVEARLEQGWALMLAGQTEAAQALVVDLQQQLSSDPWPAGEMRARMLLATLQRETGQFAESISSFDAAAQIGDRLGDLASAMAARREAAFAMTSSGDLAGAMARIEALLSQVEASGNLRELGSTLDVAAIAQQRAGDQAAAMESAHRALQAYIDAGDAAGEAAVRTNLGMLFGRVGRAADAQEHLEKALTAFRAADNRRGAAVALSNLAILYGRAGRSEAAREANESALADFREVGARLDIARLQFNLGIQDRRAGNLPDAEARMREALEGFSEMGAGDFGLAAAAALSDLLLMRAESGQAAAVLEAVDASQAAPQRAASLATARGRLAMQRGEVESAEAEFLRARSLRERAALAGWVRSSELDLAELAARQGRLAEAEQALRSLRRAMLEAGEAQDAAAAGVLLAAVLIVRERSDLGERLLDELDADPAARQDAVTVLRLDLVRAAAQRDEREQSLLGVARRARESGFEWLALRAELLAGGEAGGAARQELARRGMPDPGLVPPLAL